MIYIYCFQLVPHFNQNWNFTFVLLTHLIYKFQNVLKSFIKGNLKISLEGSFVKAIFEISINKVTDYYFFKSNI